MSLKTRLTRLERKVAATASDPFPGWELLQANMEPVERWLKNRSYANPLEAVAAGEKDYFLQWCAFRWWLQDQGYADAAEAIKAGAVVPPGLEEQMANAGPRLTTDELIEAKVASLPAPSSNGEEQCLGRLQTS